MGPLEGMRVVELAGIGPGPFAGMLLADLGADVVRVERPEPSGLGVETPTEFDLLNRNKRSVAVDLKSEQGRTQALELIRHADALIEGFRPGVAERLGLGPDDCSEVNGRLVYGRITGWGQDGPLAHSAGHDINYIALTGALGAIGSADEGPMPPLSLVGDFGGGGAYLALGIMCAIYETQRSGKGQVVDAAMVDGASSLMTAMYGLLGSGYWKPERGANVVDGGAHFYGAYETSDGKHIAIGAIERKFYLELLERIGIAEDELPAQDDRAAWNVGRSRLAALFRTRTRDEWDEILQGSDACYSPVLDMTEVPDHPHIRARSTFVEFEGVTQPAPAPRFSRTPGDLRRGPPKAGEHQSVIDEWSADT